VAGAWWPFEHDTLNQANRGTDLSHRCRSDPFCGGEYRQVTRVESYRGVEAFWTTWWIRFREMCRAGGMGR